MTRPTKLFSSAITNTTSFKGMDFSVLRAKSKQKIPVETTEYATCNQDEKRGNSIQDLILFRLSTLPSAPLSRQKGRSSTMKWLVSKNESVPQMFPFDSPKKENHKAGFEAFASAGCTPFTTTQPTQKPYSTTLQKNMVHGKRGFRYTGVALTPKSFASPLLHPDHEAIRLPTAILSNHLVVSPSGQNLICSTNAQPLPLTSPAQDTSNYNGVVGSTELRNTCTTSGGGPAQLTIFYAGSVCVYDDVSPEKAQAIMSLAGNGSFRGSPSVHVPTPALRPSSVDCSILNRSHDTTSSFSSPISLPSISCSQSVGGSVCTILPSGLEGPLFRKASLARFLEKRKERNRVLRGWPYSIYKRQSQDCNMNSSGFRPLPATS